MIDIINLAFCEEAEYNRLNRTWSFSLTKKAQPKIQSKPKRILHSSNVQPKGEFRTYLEKFEEGRL